MDEGQGVELPPMVLADHELVRTKGVGMDLASVLAEIEKDS